MTIPAHDFTVPPSRCPKCIRDIKYAEKDKEVTNPLQTAMDQLKAQLSISKKVLEDAEIAKLAAATEVNKITQAIMAIEKLVPAKNRLGKYYRPSRTFGGPGHYAEQFSDGTWACTCKGFKFNGYCWATDELKSSEAARRRNSFMFGDAVFDQRRDAAAQRAFAK